MALSFSDPSTGWSFECPAGAGGEPLAGGLVLKDVRHRSNNFARDMRLIGLRLTVAEVEPSGTVASRSSVFVQLDSASFEFGAIQELKPSLVVAPPAPPSAGSTFMHRLQRAVGALVLLKSYFKDAEGNYFGFGVRVDYTAKASLLARWANCEVSALKLSQIFLFSHYGVVPPHEPGKLLTATRCHPLSTYEMTENPALDRTRRYQRIESIRFDYRLHLTLDAKPVSFGSPAPTPGTNNAGLFRDNDTVNVLGALGGTISNLSSSLGVSKAAFAAVEKQLILEVLAPGLEKGLSTYKEGGAEYTCWDNVHWWGYRGKGPMISSPGAFHAAHMHWRWGSAGSWVRATIPEIDTTGRPKGLPKDLPGSATGSLLVDPRIWIQSIRVAVVHNHPSLDPNTSWVSLDKLSAEDWKSLFTGLIAEPLEIAEGADIVCWYSVEVHRELTTPSGMTLKNKLEGTVFLHGLFFAHEAELSTPQVGGTEPQHWPHSESAIRSGKQWFRDAG